MVSWWCWDKQFQTELKLFNYIYYELTNNRVHVSISDVKQLAWEEDRNKWLKGFNKAVGGKNKKNFLKNTKPDGYKRLNNDKSGNKRKKFKK